jgi:pyruvate,orthophosphate dikinase
VERIAARIAALRESNPMLGHRGCRLGITHPEITAMQARAIAEAACTIVQHGGASNVEILVPLVASVRELEDQRRAVERAAAEVFAERGIHVALRIGTMIEVPRAALLAGEIAQQAEFMSFGTNDLTQLVWGISRDDVASFLPTYLERGIIEFDPFRTLDAAGVGQLIARATRQARSARPTIELGVCGEHAGDPRSIAEFAELGLDYVSCSPYRVPLARLAAAQAALAKRGRVAPKLGEQ